MNNYKPWKNYGKKTLTKPEEKAGNIEGYRDYHGNGISIEEARGNVSMMDQHSLNQIKRVLVDPTSKHYRGGKKY